MLDPRATNEDLTAKARIRNAALDLYAQYGEDRVSMRAVAAAADVTLGLVQHHFKNKEGLRDAVDRLVVDYFAQTIADVPNEGSPAEFAAARDVAVQRMLAENPLVVSYIQRAILAASDRMDLLDVLVEFTKHEVTALRDAKLASTRRSASTQVVAVLVRQMGALMLEPLVDAVWERVAQDDDGPKPRLSVTLIYD
jgi:AcrR family transcriptional regulator